jgi:hypothetical protein
MYSTQLVGGHIMKIRKASYITSSLNNSKLRH